MDTSDKRRMKAAIKSALPPAPPGLRRRIEFGLPFSVGERTYQYRRLKMEEGSRSEHTDRTARVLAFIEDHAAAYASGVVPYAFRFRDGSVVSLDAGILGILSNGETPAIELAFDADGWIIGVKPVGSNTAAQTSYTLAEITTDGLAPAMDLLIKAAWSGAFVTYGDLATHLDKALGKSGLSPRHMGHVAGALMDRLWQTNPQTPLLNLLVVRGDSSEPGSGADWYLRQHFGLKGPLSDRRRRDSVQQGLYEIFAYRDWSALRQRVFGTPPNIPDPLLEIEADGQPDNPRFGRGGPESEEHQKLKAYVVDHPHVLRLGLHRPLTQPERDLPSGDRVDVEILDGARRIAVEVKSIRSGDADLVRGVYQCVKYRAVMKAQSGFGEEADCDAVLVTERALPPSTAALARRLKVRCRVLKVNV